MDRFFFATARPVPNATVTSSCGLQREPLPQKIRCLIIRFLPLLLEATARLPLYPFLLKILLVPLYPYLLGPLKFLHKYLYEMFMTMVFYQFKIGIKMVSNSRRASPPVGSGLRAAEAPLAPAP